MNLILDYNVFDSKDNFPPIFIDSLITNKCLSSLSIAGCDFNKLKFNFLLEILSHNDTLFDLNLSHNNLSIDDIRKFREVFGDNRRPLKVKFLDLSSNQIDVWLIIINEF